MTDKPTSAADPRPNNEPYYIDSECVYCGGELVLYDEYEETDREIWHDEWVCPECDNGLFMDWPEVYMDELDKRAKQIEDGNFTPLEEVNDE